MYMEAKDFKLKKFILLDSESEVVELNDVEDDNNGGLDVVLHAYTDDMMYQFSNEKELLKQVMRMCLESDGQMVRFCDFVVSSLSQLCSSAFYKNEDIELEDEHFFDEDTAEHKIPELISDLAMRYSKSMKQQVIEERKEFDEKND